MTFKNKRFFGFFFIAAFYCSCSESVTDTQNEYYSEEDMINIQKIDAHVHVNTFDTTLIHYARQFGFSLITLNVGAPDYVPLPRQQEYSLFHKQHSPDLLAYTTSFDMDGFELPGWQNSALTYLRNSFDSGALGVKVWKHIGMELKDKNGNFIMIDHDRFDTIFDFIESKNKTLVGHLGEPRNCWLPLEEMTVKNDREYFSKHPEYHMFLHKDFPSYEDQIKARDNILRKHPNLKFDGAHLGSLEYNVDTLADRLDKFPNMAVDMAERISHLQFQAKADHKKVYDFFIKYQDRLIYATDIVIDDSTDHEVLKKYCTETWTNHWKFFTSDKEMEAPEIEGKFNALHLPKSVVDKIYRKNAQAWFNNVFSSVAN